MQPRGIFARRAAFGACFALAIAAIGIGALTAHRAKALGETRTLSMFNIHTKETITVTYKKDGKFDPEALRQLNHFMRDWRKDQARDMDPELFDLIWTLHQQLGSKEPVHLICGYRTASTNESLRRRGGGQAKFSQHILGKAADITFPDVPVKTLRNSALVQEWGGVGYYPTSGVPFVHVDTGRARMWPRIPRLELAALFPSGHTKYLPIDGKPITPRDYQLALAKAKEHGETLIAMARVPPPNSRETAEAETAAPTRGPAPKPVLASYEPQPPTAPAANAIAGLPAAQPHFVLASAGGPAEEPARPKLDPGDLPVYRGAEVVSEPEADDDHPEELSYVPFETALLMTDRSVTYSRTFAPLVHPEQKDVSYLFDDVVVPVALSLRPSSGYAGLPAVQRFEGHAVRSLYAEADLASPTRLAFTAH
jgi:uncharacterized protein YcbK (DUF882 family)